jgi:VWFA-related protein
MKRVFALVTLTVLTAAVTGGAQAPQQPPAQRATGEEKTSVSAILVDVIVRDKKGEPVRGLTAADFEISEDGVRQELGSFTPVFRDPAPPAAAQNAVPAAPAAPAPAASNTPEVIALVFDRLSPESRNHAMKAAHGYVGQGAVATNVVGVFGIDLSLIAYSPFTRDGEVLRKAIGDAGGRSTSTYTTTLEQRGRARERLVTADTGMNNALTGVASGGAAAGAASGALGGAAVEQAFAEMQQRMLTQFDALERDQQGYSTSNALLAVVSAMRAVPGRKSVIFFSEGLQIPTTVRDQFISVIDAANRSNVSIYPMDAAGLRTESTQKETREGILNASRDALARNPSRDQSGGPMMAALERNEDLLRADPHSGLGTLAEQTGGFLIANTNDLRGGFSRIDSDMRNYYMLTYVPSNDVFDGKFREINVKVRRSGVSVHARKGYYAVRATPGVPVLTYETPVLTALERTPVPNAFPVRTASFRFPDGARPGLAPVVVSVPTESITFQPAADGKTYRSDFTVMARFKDPNGQVLHKMSQHYELNGPIDQMDRAKRGEVLFYREPELEPGVYIMEIAAYDALSQKASIRLSTVDQPKVDLDALRVSSLVIVKRGEKVPESERVAGSPLYVGDTLLYPNLGEPLVKGTDKEMGFYLIVYPAQGGASPPAVPAATLELLQGGRSLAKIPLQLAAPQPDGRIQQVSRIPIDALPQGTYELRIAIQQGANTETSSASFRVTGV